MGKVTKGKLYEFINVKIRKNNSECSNAVRTLRKVIEEERYGSINYKGTFEEISKKASEIIKLWEDMEVEFKSVSDTFVGNDSHYAGMSYIKRFAILDSISNEWFDKITDNSTLTESRLDELRNEYRDKELVYESILHNLRVLPNANKGVEYLTELGFELPEDWGNKNELMVPVNAELINLPEVSNDENK